MKNRLKNSKRRKTFLVEIEDRHTYTFLVKAKDEDEAIHLAQQPEAEPVDQEQRNFKNQAHVADKAERKMYGKNRRKQKA